MKTLSSLLAVFFLTTVGALAGEWQTDYKAALATAAKEKKMVLLDFTGSDWCGWCIKLDKETFDQPAFKSHADQKLVLVKLDYPHDKPQSDAVKAQNDALAKQYNIEGFPTLVLLDSSGKEIGRNVGYLAGGPEGFKQWVESVAKK